MGAWTEIVDYTVPSNTTSVVLDNFGTITKDDFIKVVATFQNIHTSSIIIRCFPNNDTTLSNYHRQYVFGNGGTVTAGRVDNNGIAATLGSSTETVVAYLKLSENDKFNQFANGTRANSSSIYNMFTYVTSTSSFASGITSLTFTATTSNAIGAGSHIQIYRLDAEKVADITVASNTTQVDISDLSIDKDSEYLLVSDFVGSVAAQLFVNDNTTTTNYYSQRIEGDGSSAAAERFNQPYFAISSVGYTHIKLSNIGAYTAQSYTIRAPGSSLRLENWFLSSTAENITSINKLNIVSTATDAIQTGTRFILYKLK